MLIYDSLSETKKDFPKTKKEIRLFVCGITPYDNPHIGHARTYLAFDIIVRYLRHQGWKIKYLQNVTDIDDKIIERARERSLNWKDFEKNYEKKYHQNEKSLEIVSVNKYAKATEHIPQIIKQVQTLIEKEFAYKIDDGYYFDVSKFVDYGKLARRTIQQSEDGVSRIDDSLNKRNKADFCLWKFPQNVNDNKFKTESIGKKFVVLNTEPFWDSPFGWGRPGWHIEDTAITEYYFGPQYDIHGGAIDLKFPHHEAEIAQQESASGKKPMVKFWMHTGFLLVNGQKMSKSSGNFITIDEFLKKYDPQVLRYIILSHHYRSPIDYDQNTAEQAKSSLATIQNFVYKLSLIKKSGTISKKIENDISSAEEKFNQSMEDDFNTPKALASIFEIIGNLQDVFGLNKKEVTEISSFVVKNLQIFGIKIEKTPKIPLKIKILAKKRERARNNKQFIQSDVLRKKIIELGYWLEDTPLGYLIYKK